LASSFSVINEFFNELAFNPSQKQAGFLFFLDWDNHDLNSVLSSAEASGAVGRGLTYLNCNVAPILKGVSEINPTVNLLVGLLNPPNEAACKAAGILNTKAAVASSAHVTAKTPAGGLFSGLDSSVFGRTAASARKASRSPSTGGGG
jgi:hypothetical protein